MLFSRPGFKHGGIRASTVRRERHERSTHPHSDCTECVPEPLELPAWLYRIAARTALDALRRRRLVRWLPLWEGDDEPCGAGEVDLPTRCAAREGIAHALARLSPTQRACLLLRARDGLSIDEIAHAMSMSKGNVKITLYRAKERFRAAYTETDEKS